MTLRRLLRFKPSHEVFQDFDVDGDVGGKSVEPGDNGPVGFASCIPNDGRDNSIMNDWD